MQEIINTILKNNVNLFGSSHKIEKINVGFTNTIYNVNDSFIIKICINTNNEKNFENEINFYNKNKENSFIPKLYYSNTDKKDIPYYYEIIEKVEGVSLYNVWHTFSEEQREEIIKQLCDFMKQMHSNTCDRYDWSKKIKDKFIILFNKAKELNIFNEEEQSLLEHAYSKFDRYLESNDFVLVHNDLHFDNIFYNNGKIKIIDFERSMYAPRDFELNIISKMIRKPWKYASEETEKFTNSSDYSNIMLYIKKYYSELVNTPNLHQRLSIYDMVYYLEQLVKHPEIEELKDDVISGAKVVALKDELTFNDVKTPNELMDYLDMNIEYGWIDKQGNKHINNLTGLRENYRTSSINEILETGLATCIEDAKIIKFFMDKMGIENKLYCYRTVESDDNFGKKVKMHCFVLFKKDNYWYHFEHSMTPIKGIHKYNSEEEAIDFITSKWEKGERELTEIYTIPEHISFKEFNQYVNLFDNCKNKVF